MRRSHGFWEKENHTCNAISTPTPQISYNKFMPPTSLITSILILKNENPDGQVDLVIIKKNRSGLHANRCLKLYAFIYFT